MGGSVGVEVTWLHPQVGQSAPLSTIETLEPGGQPGHEYMGHPCGADGAVVLASQPHCEHPFSSSVTVIIWPEGQAAHEGTAHKPVVPGGTTVVVGATAR